MADWTDHLSTLFPEVRLKKVIEVRGADCASAEMTGALGRCGAGCSTTRALDEAERLLPRLSFDEHLAFHDTARRQGLAGRLGAQELHRLAAEMVAIAKPGAGAAGRGGRAPAGAAARGGRLGPLARPGGAGRLGAGSRARGPARPLPVVGRRTPREDPREAAASIPAALSRTLS